MTTNDDLALLRSKLLVLRKPALLELMRVTSSERFKFMTHDDIFEVGEYRSISIMEEVFFEASWSTGKDVATVLRLAWSLGQEVVRKELYLFSAEWAGLEEILSQEPEEVSE